jgi:hypothetical protein
VSRPSLLFSVPFFLCATPCRADWGDAWGTLVWGQAAPAVPVLDGIGLVALALALLALGARWGRLRAGRIALFAAVVLAPLVAFGVPHVFQNGTVADADEVNENFGALETDIAGLQDALPSLAVSNEFTAARQNIEGTSTTDLGSAVDRICFLTQVLFEETDSSGEYALCHVGAGIGSCSPRSGPAAGSASTPTPRAAPAVSPGESPGPPGRH